MLRRNLPEYYLSENVVSLELYIEHLVEEYCGELLLEFEDMLFLGDEANDNDESVTTTENLDDNQES